MDSKYILEKSTAGTRIGGADFNCRSGRSVLCDARVPILERNGPLPAYTNGPVPYKCSPDGVSPVEVKSLRTSFKGNGISPGGRISLDMEKVSVFSGSGVCVGHHRPVKPTSKLDECKQSGLYGDVFEWLSDSVLVYLLAKYANLGLTGDLNKCRLRIDHIHSAPEPHI